MTPDGVVEALEVEDEVAPGGAGGEPGGQLVGVGGGEAVVADVGGELDDGGGPEAAVEVVVEQDLRCPAHLVVGVAVFCVMFRPRLRQGQVRPSRMARDAEHPSRVAPASTMARASAAVRMPPEALTPEPAVDGARP